MMDIINDLDDDNVIFSCFNCQSGLEGRYHCTVCDDYVLCVECYEKDGHPHPMESFDFSMDDPSTSKQPAKQEAPKLSIPRQNMLLLHVTQCRSRRCRLPNCQKMKDVTQHATICTQKVKGGCTECKEHFTLYVYHAERCKESKCPLPFCADIKQTLKERADAKLARKKSIDRCVESYVHSYNCQEADCEYPQCQLMKRFTQHIMVCTHGNNGDCDVCKHFLSLGCYHAKDCQDPHCNLAFCAKVKLILNKFQQRKRHQQPSLSPNFLQMIEEVLKSKSDLVTTLVKNDGTPPENAAGGDPQAEGNQEEQQEAAEANQDEGEKIQPASGSGVAPRKTRAKRKAARRRNRRVQEKLVAEEEVVAAPAEDQPTAE